MKKILHLRSSIMGAESYSIKLSEAIIDQIEAKYPGSTVEEVDLNAINIPHLSPEIFQTFFIAGEQLNEEQKAAIRFSNQAVEQLLAADIIVIGAPLYNFTIPSTLKAWIDHITRPGITFGYSETGPVGKVTGKKVYVAMSAGGVYSEGPGKDNDFVAPYLQRFLGLLGMTDVTVFRAEGLKVPGVKEHAMERALDSIAID